MLGGFGVVCGFAGLLAFGAGTDMIGIINLRPCGEVVGFKLHITACAASGMLTVVQHRPIAVGMRMGAILNDVVDRLGVGMDGLFNGSAGAGITQRALRHFNADGRGGGLRGRAADGDDQGLCIVVFLLYGRFQAIGSIGKPAGNIRACRKIFREYVATQCNAYVDRVDFFIYLAGYACVSNSGIGNARV